MARLPNATAALRTPAELDPLNARIWSNLGNSLAMNGQRGPARDAFNRSLEISPDQSYTPYNMSLIFLVEGKPAEALALSQRSTNEVFRLAGAAEAQHDLGHEKESQQALDQFIAKWGHGGAYQIAQVLAWRGEKDRAFEWLERAVKQRDGGLVNVKVDPLLRNLRGDPRYAALLKKMNLSPD
jgi:serine/threonine-protein kinase